MENHLLVNGSDIGTSCDDDLSCEACRLSKNKEYCPNPEKLASYKSKTL